MTVDKLSGMLGLAAKAGKIVSGETAVRAAIQKNQAALLLAEEGASANTQDRMQKLSAAYDLRLIRVEALDRKIGRPERTMAAVCDEGFAKAIARLTDERITGVQK